jgi:hypothetical protein
MLIVKAIKVLHPPRSQVDCLTIIENEKEKKENKLVVGFANQWANTFYFASAAYMVNNLITGKRHAIGGKKYILRQCIFREELNENIFEIPRQCISILCKIR